jgi:hypothetical protein
MEVQFIGADLGRGYVKGYTEFNGSVKQCLFKSVIGDGRSMDYSKYDHLVPLVLTLTFYLFI